MQSVSRPSGRKRNPIIEEARRKQIIDAAIQTVASVGYAQASLSRIAQHAQISKSVISYHFAGKDELLEQVVNQIYDDTWAFIQARLETETSAAGRLRTYIQANLDYMRAHRSRVLAVGDIVGSHRAADGTPRFATTTDESVITLLAAILRQGLDDGEFRDFDPQVVAVTVGQALIGAVGRWAVDPTVDLTAYAIELTTLFDRATRK
ncbi:TetR family transcriptional regulator [Nonomuraea turkmeniaca]|uniref:TetR family transcriptional regulator n=1 Tax=Nonomuraea turkmeniaca TaxID=103838 RepID=A0A5S4FX85_9ACTN|nr:TetR family transcriptional regulator [Nonomuraea turkmeniaca]TMR24884.1 TetR family transcriptional regulator [Nonomuraea turkmeniaca]